MTPNDISGAIGYVVAGVRMSTDGASVVDISDADGGALSLTSTLATRPSTGATLDGRVGIALSRAAGSMLTSQVGGVAGECVPHWMWALCSHSLADTYCGVMRMGPSGPSAVNSYLGCNGPTMWGGRGGNGAPAWGTDTGVHLLEKWYDGTSSYIARDGEVVSSVGDVGYVFASAEVGLGGGYGGTADSVVWAAGWGLGDAYPRGRAAVARWVRTHFPSTALTMRVASAGDSHTAGNGPVYPWPQRLSVPGLVVDVRAAYPSWTCADVLSCPGYASQVSAGASGLRSADVAVVWAGTNTLYFGGSADSAWAGVDQICRGYESSGRHVFVLTCLDRKQQGTPGSYEPARLDLNGRIRASASATRSIVDVALMPEFADSANAQWFQADAVHLSQAGHDLLARRISSRLLSGW